MAKPAALMPRRRDVHPVPRFEDYKTSVTRSPNLPLLSMETTTSEETGPRFGHATIGALDHDLISNFTQGAALAVYQRQLFRAARSQFRWLWAHVDR